MPMIDLRYSPGALPPEHLPAVAEGLTATLLARRGVPDTPGSRAHVWMFHQELPCLVGAGKPTVPHAVVAFTVVAGGLSDQEKPALVREATDHLRRAAPAARVWVHIWEVPDGNWGADGTITRLADAQSMLGAPS